MAAKDTLKAIGAGYAGAPKKRYQRTGSDKSEGIKAVVTTASPAEGDAMTAKTIGRRSRGAALNARDVVNRIGTPKDTPGAKLSGPGVKTRAERVPGGSSDGTAGTAPAAPTFRKGDRYRRK